MSNIDTIRALIADKPVFAKEDALLVVGLTVQLKYFPLVPSSVVFESSPGAFTSDDQTGVLTFGAPVAEDLFVVSYKHTLLLDVDIQAFLDYNVDSDDPIKLSAADALDAIADNQLIIQKKIKLLDLETDGPAMAKELRAHAASLRKQVFSADFVESTFDIIEQVNDAFGLREKIWKDWLREDT